MRFGDMAHRRREGVVPGTLEPIWALKIAAGASLIFWLSMAALAAMAVVESNPVQPPKQFVEAASAVTVFIFWLSACIATAACLWAFGAERRHVAKLRRRIAELEELPPNSRTSKLMP